MLVVKVAKPVSNVHGHGGEDRDLGSERLGGRHPDLWTGVGVSAGMRFSGDAGTHDIAHPEDVCSLLFGQTDGRQCICRLSTLRDGNDDIIRPDDGLSVAKFRSVLHLNGNAGEAFEQVLSHKTSVPRGSAPQDQHPAGTFPNIPMVVNAGQVNVP